MVCTSMRAVRSWGAMSRKRAPGRGFGVGVTGHRRCFVRRADVQRRTRCRPHDPPGPFRSRAVSHPPAQSARPAARGTQRPGGAPDECREVALLSGARAPRHGAHARDLAAHLSDAGPGRCAAAAWNRGRLLEQPPRRRPAPRRARRRDERPARDALLRSGAPRIADAPAGERRHTRVPARDRRSALHRRMGNEFRPVYRRLGVFRSLLGRPPTIALTGSATPEARADILRVLRIPDAEVVVTSFDRPNLRFLTTKVRDDRERFALIRARVRDAAGASLIYTPTRRLTELVTRALLRPSVRAAPYHAGLSTGIRRRVLRAFLSNQVNVIVATSAFGMGIDKPDVRYVLHWGPPPTLEAYYQEAGRAGRDGRASECVILWRREDFDWGNVDPEMRRYVEARRDWRRLLLEYFGERVG